MKADDQKAPAQTGPPDPEAPPQRSYARHIDCGGSEVQRFESPPPVENGRGTGRLRNPPEDH